MLEYRVENRDDYYDTLCEWWDLWKFPRVSKSSLPNCIFVVNNCGVDVYAIPVYFSDSDFCWIAFITGNKLAPKKLRDGTLSFLLSSVENHIKDLGVRLCITVNGNNRLDKLYTDSGYIVSGRNVNEYVKIL